METIDKYKWKPRKCRNHESQAFRGTKKEAHEKKKDKTNVQGVPQSQAAALPRHEEEEETDKTKQAQIEQTYDKH